MKKPMAHVSDHAVLRYLERVHGVDVGAARQELGALVDTAVTAGAGAVVIDGTRYVLSGRAVITCSPVKSVPLRGRAPRRRRTAEEDEE